MAAPNEMSMDAAVLSELGEAAPRAFLCGKDVLHFSPNRLWQELKIKCRGATRLTGGQWHTLDGFECHFPRLQGETNPTDLGNVPSDV